MAGGAVASGSGIGSHDGPKNNMFGVFLVAFAAFGGVLYGYDTGTIGGVKVMNDWLCTFGTPTPGGTAPCAISTSDESLVVSILSAGTFFGALFGAPLADWVGRRPGLMFACLVFSVGVAMQCGSREGQWALFILGRVVAGLGVALVSTIIPLYQSETAPKWVRGAVVSCYQWFITIGLLLASIINNATQDRPNHSSYQLPIGLQFIWAFILCFGMIFLPESPRFFVRKGQDEKAAKALGFLLSLPPTDPIVEGEMAEICANWIEEQQMAGTSWFALFSWGRSRILFRTFVGTWLQAWQQLTGINFIFYYGTTFFQNSGIPNPFLISVATNIVNVFMTIPGILAVDRLGRRTLLICGALLMLICEFLIAIIGVTISVENQSGQKALVALVCIYIAGFASTWGPIAWVVVGEIFPLNVRAKGVAISVASNWLWNFGIGYATPYLVDTAPGDLGLGPKVFFIWGSTCTAAMLFAFFFVPETKGLSFEQVDILIQHSWPVTSNRYRIKMINDNVQATDGEVMAEAFGEKQVPGQTTPPEMRETV
ncbi:MFS monosaccharide transporter [Dacryopinax primogenitus]|uniref:MFS monosaccharide transporter n=1 Tax=Dacryopinax primogenitus (strain DJM 731) TaxID=1858805 RepID=M5GCD7_DACPD|nr:MFS monosaccharide transporter [Dacryopinax primogenitus]EJU03827.1 MFS monosaccharide transporter [Dacryopinax primogenitus]